MRIDASGQHVERGLLLRLCQSARTCVALPLLSA